MLGALGENLLILLTFDEQNAPIIRGHVEPELFGGPYRLLAARIYDYLDRFKKPPKEHIADIIQDKLDPKNPQEAELYGDIITSMYEAQKGINAEYIMSQLGLFIKRQGYRSITGDLVRALQRDTEESLDEAERLIQSANFKALSVFDPGTRLSDRTKALEFLDLQQDAFPTGIPELDKRGHGPTRKELWLYIANTKRGKSWALIHLAKMAVMHRFKVVHITLEMSEARCSQRYIQSLFAMAKRPDLINTTRFQLDSLGRLTGRIELPVQPPLSLTDSKIRTKLGQLIDKWDVRTLNNVFIKQFPTGQLTVNQLRAYLDTLEAREKFVPDLLLIDYPDLMKLDHSNFRLSLDQAYKDIRGLAVARNLAVAVVSQAHRSSAKSELVGAENVAEAYSKIAHADVIVTYSQTVHERRFGVARLHVAGGRNDEDLITIIISQSYAMGGFVLDSVMMPVPSKTYWDLIPEDK